MTNLPAKKVHQAALLALNPKQTVAILAYLDRGDPAFGNKTRAKVLAGYAESTSGNAVFGTPEMKAALIAMRQGALEDAEHVMEDIRGLAPEAADELMSQLRIGREMEVIDPTDVFGDRLTEADGKWDDNRLRAIAAHNATLAKVMKERREAATLILAYAFGTPEQRLRLVKDRPEDELEKMLGGMSREDFERLGRILFTGEEKGPEREEDIPTIEAEVLEEDQEPEGDKE